MHAIATFIPARHDLLACDAERQAPKMGIEVDGNIVTSCIENSCLQVSGKSVAVRWVRCLPSFDEVMKDLVITGEHSPILGAIFDPKPSKGEIIRSFFLIANPITQ